MALGDGSYRVSGQKIFITYGEHDLTDNIIHFVLARLPDAPSGTRGISLFLVPKFLVNADGSLGARNGVSCGSIEHKMGIHGNSTCVMNYDSATGWLIGEENKGWTYAKHLLSHERTNIADVNRAKRELERLKRIAKAQFGQFADGVRLQVGNPRRARAAAGQSSRRPFVLKRARDAWKEARR